MSGRFRIFFVCLLILLMSGCTVWNNKWIRIRRGKNPDVNRVKLRIPSFVGPKERVERFFQAYQRRDWKDMLAMLDPSSDIRFIEDDVKADFEKHGELVAEIIAESPVYNKEEDRAQVVVQFDIERIHRQTGALFKSKGKGTFVLRERGAWDILGYLGDPFWVDSKK